MKLVKKFLRFLPCLFILCALISCCLYSIRHTGDELSGPLYYFFLESGTWDEFINNFFAVFALAETAGFESPLYAFYTWFTQNISNSYFIVLSVIILSYELFLSMAFIAFDFLNMVFGWCNKFIKKGNDIS